MIPLRPSRAGPARDSSPASRFSAPAPLAAPEAGGPRTICFRVSSWVSRAPGLPAPLMLAPSPNRMPWRAIWRSRAVAERGWERRRTRRRAWPDCGRGACGRCPRPSQRGVNEALHMPAFRPEHASACCRLKFSSDWSLQVLRLLAAVARATARGRWTMMPDSGCSGWGLYIRHTEPRQRARRERCRPSEVHQVSTRGV